jgi:nicotinamide mononucleotide (NMN) deamidase PncC
VRHDVNFVPSTVAFSRPISTPIGLKNDDGLLFAMKRRGLLAALAASGTVAVAGCAGEDGSYEFDAEPAQVPESAYSGSDYTGQEPESFTVEQEFNVTGVNAEVSATTWIARYTNQTVGSALFVASTPDASVAGQSVNPLVRVEGAELIRRLLEQVNQQGIGGDGTEIQADDIESRGEETRTVLDTETTVSIFETTISAEVSGSNGQSGEVDDIPVLVYIATVQHEEDVIAALGVHPVEIDQSEQLFSMMEAIEH